MDETRLPSSDDLIARARRGFDTPPPPPSAAEPQDDPDTRPADRVASATTLRPVDDSPVGDVFAESDAGRSASRPTPAPPAEQTPWTPSPVPRTRPGLFQRGSGILGWVIAAVILGTTAYTLFFDDTKAVEALRAGDCFDDPGVEIVAEIDGIDCAEPHHYEVFANIEFPHGSDAPFPGDDELFFDAFDRCLDRFAGYVGTSYENSAYWVDSLYPTGEGWSDGDRGATCVVFEVDGNDNLVKVTGSAAGSGR